MSQRIKKQQVVRILVADDEDEILNLYRDIFTQTKVLCCNIEEDNIFASENIIDFSWEITFDVTYCRTGHDAVENVKNSIENKQHYALAFLDIRMLSPDDGLLAGEQIRRLDSNVEIVFVTGFMDYNPKQIASRVPPVYKMLYIQKPFRIHEMIHFTYALSCKWLYGREVKERSINLEEANAALKVLLTQRDNDRKAMEEDILGNLQQIIMPMVEKLKSTRLDERQKNILKTLEANLKDITSPYMKRLGLKFFKLTPMELQVANLVKTVFPNKHIADMLGVSPGTIMAHRHQLREKLGIKNKKLNLRTYLLSIK